MYRIQSNYHTYTNKCTVKQFHSLQIVARVLLQCIYFFIKAYVVGIHLNSLTTYAFIMKIRKK